MFSALIQRRDLICHLQIGFFMGHVGKFVQTHINIEIGRIEEGKVWAFLKKKILIEKELERITLTKHLHPYNTLIIHI